MVAAPEGSYPMRMCQRGQTTTSILAWLSTQKPTPFSGRGNEAMAR